MSVSRALLVAMVVALVAGCSGGDSETSESASKSKNTEAVTADTENLRPSLASIPLDQAPFQEQFKAAGYQITWFCRFPVQVPEAKGGALVYRGGDGGGVMIVLDRPHGYEPSWHWYFKDQAPDSVLALELNDDGLWDVRVFMGDRHVDLLQDDTFTLTAAAREDQIALNGEVAAGTLPTNPTWMALDGNEFTDWRCPLSADPFVEVHAPIGTSKGVLSVRAGVSERPRELVVAVDGNVVKSVVLEDTADEQLVQLQSPPAAGSTIRVSVKSTFADTDTVSIAELGLQ